MKTLDKDAVIAKAAQMVAQYKGDKHVIFMEGPDYVEPYVVNNMQLQEQYQKFEGRISAFHAEPDFGNQNDADDSVLYMDRTSPINIGDIKIVLKFLKDYGTVTVEKAHTAIIIFINTRRGTYVVNVNENNFHHAYQRLIGIYEEEKAVKAKKTFLNNIFAEIKGVL